MAVSRGACDATAATRPPGPWSITRMRNAANPGRRRNGAMARCAIQRCARRHGRARSWRDCARAASGSHAAEAPGTWPTGRVSTAYRNRRARKAVAAVSPIAVMTAAVDPRECPVAPTPVRSPVTNAARGRGAAEASRIIPGIVRRLILAERFAIRHPPRSVQVWRAAAAGASVSAPALMSQARTEAGSLRRLRQETVRVAPFGCDETMRNSS